MTTPRAIFFDLDDTLISSYGKRLPSELWRLVFSQNRKQLSNIDIDSLVSRLVETATAMWRNPPKCQNRWLSTGEVRRIIAEDALESFGLKDRELAHVCADAFTAIREREMHLFEGALDTIVRLRELNTHLTMITNGASVTQRWKINRFELAQYFDHIQIEEEAGVGKPRQEAYKKALARIKSAPEDVWMIGDHLENDVAGSQKLGLTGVWFNGHNLERNAEVSPHHEVNSHAELQKLLFNR